MDTDLRKSQARHKQDYDWRVREKPSLHSEENVFLNEPPLPNASNSRAETLAWKSNNWPQLKMKRQFHFVCVKDIMITDDKNGMPNLSLTG